MDQIYKEVLSFQRRCNDYIDDRSHSAARALQQEVQRFEDEAQVKKNPRSLEDRAKSVIRYLEKAGEDQVMSQHHVRELVERCEHFRIQFRKLG